MSPGLLDQTHTCCEINCVSPMWPPTLSESLWNNWGNDWMQKKHCWLSAVVQVSFEHRTTTLVATSLQAPSCGSSMTANVAGLLFLPDVFLCTAFHCTQACCKASSTGLLQSKQYRFAAKQAVQVCCKAGSTGLLQSN